MALERGQPLLSLDDYLLLPDEPLGEVLDGVFTVTPTPTPRHQLIAGHIHFLLKLWLRDHPDAGFVASAPLDVVLRAERPALILQPDVLFIEATRAAIVQQRIMGAPDLVVEVVSPSSVARDAVTKRDTYAKSGVREYWLVWPNEERVDVFGADGSGGFGQARTLHLGEALASPLLPGLTLDLAEVFAEGRRAP